MPVFVDALKEHRWQEAADALVLTDFCLDGVEDVPKECQWKADKLLSCIEGGNITSPF